MPHSRLPRRLPAWLWPLALFLVFLAASPGRVIAFDVAIRSAVAHALWSHGSPFVTDPSPEIAGMIDVPGRGHTSFYGIGQSLVFLPFEFVGTQLARFASLFPSSLRIPWSSLPLIWIYTPLVGILWWFAIAASVRLAGASVGASRRFAALFLFATVAGVYAATTLQEEAIVGALVVGGFVCIARWCRSGADRDAALGGLLLGASLLFRLNAVFAFLPIVGYAIDTLPKLARAIRGVTMAVLGALPALAIFCLFSHWRYGAWFATGYAQALSQNLGVVWTNARPALALDMVWGGGKGVLLLSPFALLAVFGLVRIAPKRPRFVGGMVLAFTCASLLCSRLVFNPDGSECWSVRYLVHLLGLLAYPAYVGMRRVPKRVPQVLFALGCACQLVALFAPDSLEYLQSDQLGHNRYTLIDSAREGQFALRLRNIAHWIAHREIAEPSNADIQKMREEYVPNLWGPVYARKLGGKGFLAYTAWTLWVLTALLGGALTCCLLIPKARRRSALVARSAPQTKYAKAG